MIPAGTYYGLPVYMEVLPLNQAFTGQSRYATVEQPYYGEATIIYAQALIESPAIPEPVTGTFVVVGHSGQFVEPATGIFTVVGHSGQFLEPVTGIFTVVGHSGQFLEPITGVFTVVGHSGQYLTPITGTFTVVPASLLEAVAGTFSVIEPDGYIFIPDGPLGSTTRKWSGYHHHVLDHTEGHQAILAEAEKFPENDPWPGGKT